MIIMANNQFCLHKEVSIKMPKERVRRDLKTPEQRGSGREATEKDHRSL